MAGPVIGVIPARWNSTRFPGKPLAMILGKPMIQYVHERARACELLDRLIIATDDERIRGTAELFGAEVAMTSGHHVSGSDRASEAVRDTGASLVVNIQGDEPLLCADSVDKLVRGILADPSVGMATLACKIEEKSDLDNPSCVKVVLDRAGDAIYFSRSRIPFVVGDRPFDFYKHIGIYAYRREVLDALVASPPSSLELAEGLEQLRALEQGVKIRVVKVRGWGPSVDTPADIVSVEKMMKKRLALDGRACN